MPRQAKTERFGSKNAEALEKPALNRSERKRADIVAAAKEVFFKEGYAHASMDEITARSGVSKATVYAHFGSKDELLLAVVDDVIRGMRAAMAADLPEDGGDIRAWLTKVGELGCRQLTSPAAIALQRIAIAEANRFPEIAQALRRTGADTVLAEEVRPAFEAAIANGTFRKSDPRIAISHFFEICVGKMLRDVLLGLSSIPSTSEIESSVRLGVEAFLRGYLSDGSTGSPRRKKPVK
jgi:AcrR family transcriptional regulator